MAGEPELVVCYLEGLGGARLEAGGMLQTRQTCQCLPLDQPRETDWQASSHAVHGGDDDDDGGDDEEEAPAEQGVSVG